jgi:hypothetical protein
MRKCKNIYEEAVSQKSYMTLQLLPSGFPYTVYEEFSFSFLSGTNVLYLRPSIKFYYLLCIWIKLRYIWPIVSVPWIIKSTGLVVGLD